ncbi:helix-turn-helix domain-containing protein [Sansalvadorimonas sp. 2012CJ34-2]|uniref:Helix-turn-helix domain-containing protein n=1 Tax=Parendozoicomonas callyspongiae TaxID=2942213 RepID=A0ABT0PIN9_9GAMM|nr:helix-turn-helix transcriptional regulator [Sansalvadorimonas sp. 2012CJ34-2]MCL6271225.1 helix-turn-helix domain-containing protein [Sansalvadorimonas sp. 2012CJ34-2]
MSILDQWLEESADNQIVLDEESLILEIAEQFWQQLSESDTSKAELARRMGISKARVSKLLDGSNNLTLRKIANMATALKLNVNFTLEPAESNEGETWEQERVVSSSGCKIYKFPKPSSQGWDDTLEIAL